MFNGQRGVSCCLREPSHPKRGRLKKQIPERVWKVPIITGYASFLVKNCMDGGGEWVGSWIPEENDKGGYHWLSQLPPQKESEGGKEESIKHTIMEDMGLPTDSLVSGWARCTHAPQLYRRAITMQDGSAPHLAIKMHSETGVAGF